MTEQEGRFAYDCPAPDCDGEMRGSFGDDVTCPKCGRTYETDWDYINEDSMSAWIVREIVNQTPTPNPCAHPRAILGEETRDAMNWITAPWSCPDCGQSGAMRFHRSPSR